MNRTVYVCLGDRGKEAKRFNLSRYCFSVHRHRAIRRPPARPFQQSHSPALSELLGAGPRKGHLHSAAHGQVDARTPLALAQMLAIRKAQQVQGSTSAVSMSFIQPLPSSPQSGSHHWAMPDHLVRLHFSELRDFGLEGRQVGFVLVGCKAPELKSE